MRRAALRRAPGSLLCALACALGSTSAPAEVTAIDDSGHRLSLPRPAERIVSLSPHATELLFAAGAGHKLTGVSAYSDYPPAAKSLPSVGSSMQLDIERIIALKPDLVVAWQSGNNARQVARLRKLGIAVFDSEPRTLDDIASNLSRLGELAGTPDGRRAADDFRQQKHALQARYAGRTPVRVFYQIWPAPLMTLNDRHIVSDALRLCGAVNIFGRLSQLAPTVSREAVAAARPQAIFASDERGDSWDSWKALAQLPAVRLGNLYRIDGAVMNRAGPRMLDATSALCRQVDEARVRLASNPALPASKSPAEQATRKETP